MGKQSRRKRELRDRPRDDRRSEESAHVAEEAAKAAAMVWDATAWAAKAQYGPRAAAAIVDSRLPHNWDRVRREVMAAGTSWPAWSYLPCSMVGWAVQMEMVTAGGLNPAQVVAGDGFLQPSMRLAPVAAWSAGRVAVRYHPALADALRATKLNGEIPTEVLYRLPAWGLYLPLPHLHPTAGVFVTLDPRVERVIVPGEPSPPPVEADQASHDELVMTVVVREPDPVVFVSTFWLAAGSIAESISLQRADGANRANDEQSERELAPVLGGRSLHQLHTEILSLLLYLASDRPDVDTRTVPAASARSRSRDASTVLDTGWRIGAALASTPANPPTSEGALDGEPGVSPRAHLRTGHWHHYWTGPRSDPAHRKLVLHYLHPMLVGGRASGTVTVRRAD